MKPDLPGRIAQRSLLVIPALCALLMIGAFYHLHERRGARVAMSHVLPGITLENPAASGQGLIVTSIRSDGLHPENIAVGDRIVAIDGDPVQSLDQAVGHLVEDRQDNVVIGLVHQGQLRQIAIARPDEDR